LGPLKSHALPHFIIFKAGEALNKLRLVEFSSQDSHIWGVDDSAALFSLNQFCKPPSPSEFINGEEWDGEDQERPPKRPRIPRAQVMDWVMKAPRQL